MRRLTFKGFLEQYLTELSCGETCAVSKLDKELDNNLRLREPLALYIALYKPEYQVKSEKLQLACDYLCSREIVSSLEQQKLKPEFNKVYVVYKNKVNVFENEADTKQTIRNRVLEKQFSNRISNYSIYKALGLNPGNVNDYLKNGNTSKLSLETAYLIYDYVSGFNSAVS